MEVGQLVQLAPVTMNSVSSIRSDVTRTRASMNDKFALSRISSTLIAYLSHHFYLFLLLLVL
jgi:hypothetical protein